MKRPCILNIVQWHAYYMQPSSGFKLDTAVDIVHEMFEVFNLTRSTICFAFFLKIHI